MVDLTGGFYRDLDVVTIECHSLGIEWWRDEVAEIDGGGIEKMPVGVSSWGQSERTGEDV